MIGVIPFGSWEFHGPHLPASTDRILAEYFALSLSAGVRRESWLAQLAPIVAYGISEEHLWHQATLSVTASTLRAIALDVCDAMRRTTGITQFIFLNCHGGNRPTLEQVCDELYFSPLGTEAILVNPVSLVAAQFSNNPIPDVHAGLLETSLLLAIAPDQVDMTALRELDFSILNAGRVRDRIARRGVYWPWSSEDPTLAVHGIIGDPRQATAELGREIIIAAQEALLQLMDDFASAPRTERRGQDTDGQTSD